MVWTVRRWSRLGARSLACLAIFQLSSFLSLGMARADVLFEGYAKILLSGIHVGFTVQRYEFDPIKKEFAATYYLKTNATAGNLTESLKARASSSLAPIGYQYTELTGEKARTIDASVRGETMNLSIKDGAKQNVLTKKVPKGAFFASFLAYVMLQGPEGIKSGAKYGYQAVAEEDGNLYTGEAYVTGEETVLGLSAFKVLNTFKGARFISWVTHKGEVIATKSPVQQIETEVVSTLQEATEGLSVNTNNLSLLFGGVPKGTENAVARKTGGSISPPTDAASATSLKGQAGESKKKILEGTPPSGDVSPKKEGVPGGQGITLKGAPAVDTKPAAAPQPTPKSR